MKYHDGWTMLNCAVTGTAGGDVRYSCIRSMLPAGFSMLAAITYKTTVPLRLLQGSEALK